MRHFLSHPLFASGSLFRRRPTSLLSGRTGPEVCESRLLLTATSHSVVVSTVAPQPAQEPPGNFAGFWFIDGEGSHHLAMLQTGNVVSGNEMDAAIPVGTLTGKVNGNKLKAEIVGADFTRTYKVKLTDQNHFVGTRRTIIGGHKEKESVSATEVT